MNKDIETIKDRPEYIEYLDKIIENITPKDREDENDISLKFQEWNQTQEKPLGLVERTDIWERIVGPYLKETFKITQGDKLLGMKIRKFPWVVDSLIPIGAITSLVADSGKGKSIVALIIAKAIATGEPFLGEFRTKKSKVLIIDQEMDRDIIISRHQAIIQDKNIDIDYMYEQSWMIDNEDNYQWLRDKILEKKYKVLILDTLTMIHSSDENSNNEMKPINIKILRLIRETKITVIYLHHNRKRMKGEKVTQAASRGAVEIISKVTSHLMLNSVRKMDNMDPNLIIHNMTIEQGKVRRPDDINLLGLDVTYNKATKKTTWEYAGRGNVEEGKIKNAKKEIMSVVEESPNNWTIKKFREELPNYSDTIMRDAVRELVQKGLLQVDTSGKGVTNNTKIYSLKIQDELPL